jgi:uncharacterized protein (DUF2236 family)
MYEFGDKLFNVALPRVRDFRGIGADSFDGRGNFSMGVKEQLIFPEIEYDKVDKVRGIHRRVHGVARDGRPYRADDPHLLEWVHIAEIDSFLLAHRLYGAKPLDQSGRDAYVSDTARVASALGVVDPPQTEAELRERIEAFRPELRSTEAARDAARFLLITPPLPLLARGPYGVIAATSVSMLPSWARLPLRLPYFPPVEATAIRAAGRVLVGGIRWAMSAHPPPEPAAG